MAVEDRSTLGQIERRQWASDQHAAWMADVRALVAIESARRAASAAGFPGHGIGDLAQQLQARIVAGPRPWPSDELPGPSFPIDSHQLRRLYDWASHDDDAASIQLTSLPDGSVRATQGDESEDFARLDA